MLLEKHEDFVGCSMVFKPDGWTFVIKDLQNRTVAAVRYLEDGSSLATHTFDGKGGLSGSVSPTNRAKSLIGLVVDELACGFEIVVR